MKQIKKILKKLTNNFSPFLVIGGYTVINIIFNYRIYWRQIFSDLTKTGAIYGEVQVYEWALEKFYQTLMSGKNPFGTSTAILYPFGLNFSMLDLGNGLFFPLLRPFLSPHQTMSILVTVSLIVANIGMYLLLRKLNFSKMLSFIVGAAYGYMTFLMPRAGHLSYWSIFIFPWFYYFTISLISQKNKITKNLSALGVSIIFVLALWINFYYFIILLISIFSVALYFLLSKTGNFFIQTIKLWKHLVLILFFSLIFLTPWLIGLYELFIFDLVPKTRGWGGAIEFSSDLFNYIIPSEYGYFITKFPVLLKPISLFLQLFTIRGRSIFENFTYPGIIILTCYSVLIFLYRKFDKKTKENIKPFLFVSAIFFVLTLGPFLHVFGHWTLTLDDGIRIVIPLPYIVLHYIPFLNNIRVPGRLIVGFIFFAYIVCAYIINNFLKNKSVRFKQVFFAFLFLIFVVDQRVTNNILPPPQIHPYSIFNIIKTDREKVSVMEIPFTVRDGFTYFGDLDAVGLTVGQPLHEKSVIGGYFGRISDYKRNYYMKNPFFGYLGRLIDTNVKINPGINQADLPNWINLDIIKSKNTINFLDLKYIIMNDKMPYVATLSANFKDIGFYKEKEDKNFSLWARPIDKKEFLNIDMNDPNDLIYLGMGWFDKENNFRFASKRSSVMFKVLKKRKFVLNFEASAFYKKQKLKIYLNKKEIGQMDLSVDKKNYKLPIDVEFDEGINFIYFFSNNEYQPSKVIPGNLDERRISFNFNRIFLTELK